MGSIDDFSRYSFPDDFVFGTSSSAYQYEGETNKHGRGPAIWDTFTEEHTERINDHSNGNVAVDFYHRYKEDVQRMKEMGMDAFRFSISWSRVLPHGRLSAGVNEEGIKFYNDLIDDLLKNGLQPYVTLFHWDSPQALEDKYGGFLSSNIVNDFRDFVDLCFQKFGDRVKKWITLNEPWMFSVQGYDMGKMAPGRISVVVNDPHRSLNTGATEVYTVSHHLLLAHAAAVKLYKEKYQSCQGGQIGITLVSYWFEPYSNSEDDQNATKRSLDFMLGWFMDPLTNGDYPRNMHDFVGGRLPKFTAEESKMLKGSYDFIGINYYTTYYAQNIDANYQSVGFMSDARANWTGERNGIPIGPQAGVKWLYIYPEGISRLLNYTKDLYGNPTIYITENGVDDVNNNASSLKEALNDPIREKSYKDHLKNVLRSINEHGVDVKGFFAWSLMDNFEWGSGYAVRFGLYYVDYKNDLKRYPKKSVKWFKQFLRRDSHSPIPHTYPLITSNETSKIEDSLVRDAKRPRNA
ncbi:beta-glucosidase 12-like [Populus nigra]|uniref:beta-glucosidase 12-like n=1 Tax=Populus nigra TaxID=3691 RepID=UPI002B271F79|nr:beta-glucosidase 12-like [Populus nigra]